MKVLISAEWRLGTGSIDAATVAIERTGQIALDSRVSLYVFLGGLASKGSPLVHRASALAVDVARRLHAAGIPSLWIAGASDRVADGLDGTALGAVAASGFGRVITTPEIVDIDGHPKVVALPYGAYKPEHWLRQKASKMKAADRAKRVLALGSLPVGVNGAAPDLVFPARECLKWFPNATLIGGHHGEAEQLNGVELVGSLSSEQNMLLLEL